MDRITRWDCVDFCEYAKDLCEVSGIRKEIVAVGGVVYVTFDKFNCTQWSEECPPWRCCPLIKEVYK